MNKLGEVFNDKKAMIVFITVVTPIWKQQGK